MASLASVDDVKRILRVSDDDPVRDARLRAALEAVESVLSKRITIPASGPQMETYWDIPEDHTLTLPASDVTVTLVKVFEYPSSFGIPLSPIELGLGHGYDITGEGQLILRPTLNVSPFEGAIAQRKLRTYNRVEVYFIGTGVVPAGVTEGIAFAAAGYDTDGPRALVGLTSEKIGDYAYTVKPAGTTEEPASYISTAMWFLTPFFRKARIQTV
jgi:hypothetical protein